jgi:hypothetical protein
MLALHYFDHAYLLPVYILDPPLLDPQVGIHVETGPIVHKSASVREPMWK